MSSISALEIAIRRLRKSRYPRLIAAASALAEVHQVLIETSTGAVTVGLGHGSGESSMTLVTDTSSGGTGALS